MSALNLPLPPALTELWRIEGGRIVRTAAYRGWLDAVREAVRASTQRSVLGPYVLSVTAVRPAEGESAGLDLDAVLKPLTTALRAAGLVGDDSLAERIVVRWARGPAGHLEVEARAA